VTRAGFELQLNLLHRLQRDDTVEDRRLAYEFPLGNRATISSMIGRVCLWFIRRTGQTSARRRTAPMYAYCASCCSTTDSNSALASVPRDRIAVKSMTRDVADISRRASAWICLSACSICT
jgi:hypothetical protein